MLGMNTDSMYWLYLQHSITELPLKIQPTAILESTTYHNKIHKHQYTTKPSQNHSSTIENSPSWPASITYWFLLLIIYFKITMLKNSAPLFFLFLAVVYSQLSSNASYITPCSAFRSGRCVACPYNYHQYQSQCYLNVTGCLQYSANASGYLLCTACDSSIAVLTSSGGCALTVTEQQLANSAYLRNVAANYGDMRFVSIALSEALNDQYFLFANNFMLNGEYKHFISLTSQPIQSVATYSLGSMREYKILYSGSGGGLMLCLISIDSTNNAIRLSSFVSIGLTNIVNNCDQYSTSIECLQCLPGYHLENSICYLNVENCVSYYRNICLRCAQYSYLIQNRCVTTCQDTADGAQMPFLGDVRLLLASAFITISRSYLL